MSSDDLLIAVHLQSNPSVDATLGLICSQTWAYPALCCSQNVLHGVKACGVLHNSVDLEKR